MLTNKGLRDVLKTLIAKMEQDYFLYPHEGFEEGFNRGLKCAIRTIEDRFNLSESEEDN